MSEPTAYDLTQDERLDGHDSLLAVSDVAPAGAQISYPVVGQPLSDAQWQTIAASMGNGVISPGGGPYEVVDARNTDDTVRINVSAITGTAEAILSGFFHQLRAPIRVSIPAVTKTTTYYICLTYDPLRSQSADGPISIQVYTSTPPTSSGKKHIVLATVVRQANQVLTDAQINRIRPTVSPTMWVLLESHKPDPSTLLWGTACRVHESGKTYIACSPQNSAGYWAGKPDRWEELAPDYSWNTLSFASNEYWSGSYPAWRKEGNRAQLRGKIYRTPSMNPGNSYTPFLTSFPADIRPNRAMNFAVSGYTIPSSGSTYGYPADVCITPDGAMIVTNQRDGILVGVSLDGINYPLD